VSDSRPGDDNPFQGIPFLGDIAKLLAGQGPVNWDAARQFAQLIATEGTPEANVDPSLRIQYQELSRLAEMHVREITGLETTVGGRSAEVVAVTPGAWAHRSLDSFRPLFERLASALGSAAQTSEDSVIERADDGAAFLGPLFALMSPMLLGMSAGTMVGHLAQTSFGQYDLPIPRPPTGELLVVAPTIEHFAEEWSLPHDDLRLWVCVQELAMHSVLSVPHIRAQLDDLVGGFVGAFRPDTRALEERLSDFDPTATGIGDLQRAFGDPEMLLGAMQTPEQENLRPHLDALVALVVGFADHTVDQVAARLLGSSGRITEAVRRRRLEADQADRFVERLLGLSISAAQVERGSRFVSGVIERAGLDGLARLWQSTRQLPTPNELDAPGLWLARIELP
jgi:putative hydrolase